MHGGQEDHTFDTQLQVDVKVKTSDDTCEGVWTTKHRNENTRQTSFLGLFEKTEWWQSTVNLTYIDSQVIRHSIIRLFPVTEVDPRNYFKWQNTIFFLPLLVFLHGWWRNGWRLWRLTTGGRVGDHCRTCERSDVFDVSLHFLSRPIRHQSQISGFQNLLAVDRTFVRGTIVDKESVLHTKMGDLLHFRLNGIWI